MVEFIRRQDPMIRFGYTVLGLTMFVLLFYGRVCSAGALTPFSDAGDLWGFQDPAGQIVIAPQYIMALDFSKQGVAAVIDQQGWLYIDQKGNPLVRPFVFDNGPDYFVEGLSRYVENGKIGFIDRSGRIVIPAAYDFARPFSDARAAVCNGCRQEPVGEHRITVGGKWGYIDPKGKIVIPLEFDGVDDFAYGRAEVRKNGRDFEIDRQGREVGQK